jgi:ubiquinone/menaquinone biosynthesis C-methylase UbiE
MPDSGGVAGPGTDAERPVAQASAPPVEEIYNQVATAYDRTGPRFLSYFGRRLVELAQIPAGASVLDVATGRGAILFPAAERAGSDGRVVGVDLSAGMLHETAGEVRGAGLGHVFVCRMDADALAFPPACFDYVLCGNAIFYFPQASHEFYRVLRPGGTAGVSTLARGCMDWIVEALQPYQTEQEGQDEQEADLEAIHTPEGLAALLRGAGFQNLRVQAEDASFLYPDEEAWWAVMWTLGLRGAMQTLAPGALVQFKQDIFAKLQQFRQADGILLPFRVLCALGDKPKNLQASQQAPP